MKSTAVGIETVSPPRNSEGSPRWAAWFLRPDVILRATFFASLLIYLRTITFDWVFDDHVQVVLNPWLWSWGSVKQMFTLHSWAFSDYGFAGKFYRPLYLVWLLINNKLFGALPGWFHLTGVLLHLGVVWLAYLTAKRILNNERWAAIAAALFALHPTKVESVAWVAGLTEPLLALFFFGCVLAYLRWEQTGANQSRWLVLSVACFACAIFAKETAVFAPILVLIHYGAADRDDRLRGLVRVTAPYFLVALAYWIIRWRVMSGIAQLGGKLSIAKTIYTIPIAFWWYFKHTVWPFGLSLLYPEMIVKAPSFLLFVLPLIGLVGLLGIAFWWARKSIVIRLMSAWTLLTLLPPIGTILLVQPHDRYLYLPSFGAAVITAELLRKCNPKQTTTAILLVLMVVVFGAASFATTSYWENDLAIFKRGMDVAPDNPAARTFYSGALMNEGDKEGAFKIMLEGVKLRPDSANLNLQLAQMYESVGNYDEAESYYERTLTLNADARFLGICHYSLGNLAQKRGDLVRTEAQYKSAIEASPTAAGYHQALGILLRNEGRNEEARHEFEQEEQIRVARTRNFR